MPHGGDECTDQDAWPRERIVASRAHNVERKRIGFTTFADTENCAVYVRSVERWHYAIARELPQGNLWNLEVVYSISRYNCEKSMDEL